MFVSAKSLIILFRHLYVNSKKPLRVSDYDYSCTSRTTPPRQAADCFVFCKKGTDSIGYQIPDTGYQVLKAVPVCKLSGFRL